MLDHQRQKELSGMRPAKLREDKIILLNIKGKEKDNTKVYTKYILSKDI